MTQLDTNTSRSHSSKARVASDAEPSAVKRFNLYLPPGLWRRLERFIQRRSRETEANITPNAEIRRAIEKHLENAEGSSKKHLDAAEGKAK